MEVNNTSYWSRRENPQIGVTNLRVIMVTIINTKDSTMLRLEVFTYKGYIYPPDSNVILTIVPTIAPTPSWTPLSIVVLNAQNLL